MNCMRCGRGIALGQAFCKDCLTDMEQHPVKPGTPIQIPAQPAATVRKSTPSRKAKKPEEQISRLRRIIFIQTVALMLLVAAFGVTVFLLTNQIDELEKAPIPGQNYNTMAPTQATTQALSSTQENDVSRETFEPSVTSQYNEQE